MPLIGKKASEYRKTTESVENVHRCGIIPQKTVSNIFFLL